MIVKNGYTMCLLALLTMVVGLACKKVIQVNLHEASSRVVIEGEITDIPGIYQVKISRTVPYSDDNIFPPVQGAIVQVTDSNNGILYPFVETYPGLYTCKLRG